MSSVETRKFEPATGTAVNLGASGDAVTLPAGVTLQTNTIKDSGGNTIFTSDGAGNLSSVNSGLQGGMVFISSQTASSSSSLSFTTGIDSTYDEYVFYFVNINLATDVQDFRWQGSIDGGSNYNVTNTSTFFRARHGEDASQGNLGYDEQSDTAEATTYLFLTELTQSGNGADECISGELHLFNPASTTYVKNFYATTNQLTYDNRSNNAFSAGYFNTTSAVNAVQFKSSSGNFSGLIYLYGIK